MEILERRCDGYDIKLDRKCVDSNFKICVESNFRTIDIDIGFSKSIPAITSYGIKNLHGIC